jgi:hypothetical protein
MPARDFILLASVAAPPALDICLLVPGLTKPVAILPVLLVGLAIGLAALAALKEVPTRANVFCCLSLISKSAIVSSSTSSSSISFYLTIHEHLSIQAV